MEWFAGFAVAVVAVLLVGVRHVGARRVAAGDQRAVWLVFAPTIFFAFVFLFAGLLVTVRSGPIGLFMVGLGVVSLVLLIRMARATAKAPTGPDGVDIDIGDGPWIDYIVWGALLVPLLIGVALVIAVIIDRLS